MIILLFVLDRTFNPCHDYSKDFELFLSSISKIEQKKILFDYEFNKDLKGSYA